ncbi:MAG: hypothetical protein ONB44_10815 [candidate division KSB1 bacterium]|nr:hypothetical protein [candidate division KSB1 bacterium]MDZ7302615.1 hypothetical protein [candidate division KSB1 bacterium]
MKSEKTNLMTTGNMAKELGVSDAKIKKVIKELGIKPEAKKGVCSYYSRSALAKIKAALK